MWSKKSPAVRGFFPPDCYRLYSGTFVNGYMVIARAVTQMLDVVLVLVAINESMDVINRLPLRKNHKLALQAITLDILS